MMPSRTKSFGGLIGHCYFKLNKYELSIKWFEAKLEVCTEEHAKDN